jgi:ribosomal protein S18 acetylase RimI-like enzyme
MTEITIQYRPATQEEREKTVQELKSHTLAAVGMAVEHIPFGLLAYEGEWLIGSIVGKIVFNWLHLDLVWVADNRRRLGVGRHLMKLAGVKAEEMKLGGIEVWTQSWQAPEFYRKIGYEEFAVIDDFTPGNKRHAFRLTLQPPTVMEQTV